METLPKLNPGETCFVLTPTQEMFDAWYGKHDYPYVILGSKTSESEVLKSIREKIHETTSSRLMENLFDLNIWHLLRNESSTKLVWICSLSQ